MTTNDDENDDEINGGDNNDNAEETTATMRIQNKPVKLNHVTYNFKFLEAFESFEKGVKAIEAYWLEKKRDDYPALLVLIRTSETEEELMKYIVLFMSRMTLVYDISYGFAHGYLSKRYLYEMHRRYATALTSLDDGSSQCNRSLCSRDGIWFMAKHGYKRVLKSNETNDLNLDTYSKRLTEIAITDVTKQFIEIRLVEAINGCKLAKEVKFQEYAGKISAVSVALVKGGKIVLKEESYEPEIYLKREIYDFVHYMQN